MTNQAVQPNQTTTPQDLAQESPDAWAYRALGEPVPGEPDSKTASNQSANSETKGASGTPNPQTQTGGDAKSQTPNGTTPKLESAESDPLSKLALDDLLKHPTLGPVLNSWNDKTTNSRLDTERPRLTRELEPQIKARLEQEETREYLEGLSDGERGQILSSNPELATAWSNIQASKSRLSADPESVARTAQVYALAAQISVFDGLIKNSGLPDDIQAQLSDTKEFEPKGPAGIVEWGQKVLESIADFKATSKSSSELETKWQSYLEEHKSQLPRPRPGLSVPGRNANPAPDVFESKSHDFLSAFN